MIGSIRHEGLKRLYEHADARSIGSNMRNRVAEILTIVEAAETVEQANIPGYRLHALSGDRQGYWSVRVTGNWRITFCFIDGRAEDGNLEDYH